MVEISVENGCFQVERYGAWDKTEYIRAIIDFALEREDLRDVIDNYL